MKVFSALTSHQRAVLQALFVTFLWSTSWVLIKLGLMDIPALTFAGLRYMLAFLVLLPFVARGDHIGDLRRLSRRGWGLLIALGVLLYAVTQGAQFMGLSLLPAVTVSLIYNMTPILVALLAMPTLGEIPTRQQWLGMAIFIVGALVYFYPIALPEGQLTGVLIVAIGVCAGAGGTILGRSANRSAQVSPLAVTTVSMGVGAVLMLGAGAITQGIPPLSPINILVITWLAVVNTAFAFTLFNRTLRTLSAMESSLINNTMMVQIAILAWIFLGEDLDGRQIAGLVLAAVGVLIVQLRRRAPVFAAPSAAVIPPAARR